MKPLTPTTPHVIILVGIPGAGKTHFAEHFAKTFHAPYINQGALQALADGDEAKGARLMTVMLDELLKTHRTIIVEGSTHQRTIRTALIRKLTKAGYEPLLVWVQTDPAEAKFRSLKHMSADDYAAAIKRFQPPVATEKPIVISGKHTYASQVKKVLKHLAHVHPEPEATVVRPRTGRNILIR